MECSCSLQTIKNRLRDVGLRSMDLTHLTYEQLKQEHLNRSLCWPEPEQVIPEPEPGTPCSECNGTGWVAVTWEEEGQSELEECGACFGTGSQQPDPPPENSYKCLQQVDPECYWQFTTTQDLDGTLCPVCEGPMTRIEA